MKTYARALYGKNNTANLTPDEVRASLRARGMTIAGWARINGFTSEQVYRVLTGKNKGLYGKAYAIVVKLGLPLQKKAARGTK